MERIREMKRAQEAFDEGQRDDLVGKRSYADWEANKRDILGVFYHLFCSFVFLLLLYCIVLYCIIVFLTNRRYHVQSCQSEILTTTCLQANSPRYWHQTYVLFFFFLSSLNAGSYLYLFFFFFFPLFSHSRTLRRQRMGRWERRNWQELPWQDPDASEGRTSKRTSR